MVASRATLIIPVENQVRELDPKLLLACVAAERGFPVVLGSRTRIDFRIASLARGIYLAKGMTPRNVKMFSIIRRLGHEIVVWDEEALVHSTPYHYYSRRMSGDTLELVSKLFAWGEENAEMFAKFPAYPGTPIEITGNPRGDMLRPELRPFYEEEAASIRDRFGKFTMINTNFAMVNGFLETQNLLRPGEAPGDPLRTGAQAAGLKRDFVEGYAAHKGAIFEHMKRLVSQLCAAFGDQEFIVRPHPGENREPWEAIAGAHANARVVHEGNIIPWLMATDAVIHNGCTTGLEAFVMGRPVIAYQPVRHQEYDYHLPNLLSHRCEDAGEVCRTLGRIIAGELGSPESAEQQRLIARSLSARSGRLASDRIIDAIERSPASRGELPPVAQLQRMRAWLDATRRSFVKQAIKARIPGHRNNPAFQRHRFQGVTVDDLKARLGRLARSLGRFEGVEVEQSAEHIFRIRA
jgi:surface carbohydrate biosynthesis protein